MRAGLVMSLLLLGCTDGEAPLPFDAHVALDGAADLTPIDTDGPPPGDGPFVPMCQTACDCPAGQRCRAGTCTADPPITFCCGSSACTGDQLCQQPGGQVSQCSLPPDAGVPPGPDGGATSCSTTACVKGAPGDILCQIACAKTTARCVGMGGSGTHCMP